MSKSEKKKLPYVRMQEENGNGGGGGVAQQIQEELNS